MPVIVPVMARMDKCEFDANHTCTRCGYNRGRPFDSPYSFMTCPEGRHCIVGWRFWCPACNEAHYFTTRRMDYESAKRPIWSFNGNRQCPSFEPSLRYLTGIKCHVFVRVGVIEFCDDCPHAMKGMRVPLPTFPESE